MNLFEAKAAESIKDQALYNFINPALSKKLGTKETKDNTLKKAKADKSVDMAKLLELSKTIEKPSSGIKIQRHIALPAALYLLKNKKKINPGITETIIRAQKDYFFKSFPQKEKTDEKKVKDTYRAIKKAGMTSGITTNELFFIRVLKDEKKEFLALKDTDQFLKRMGFTDISSIDTKKKDDIVRGYRAQVREYSDSDYLELIKDVELKKEINNIKTTDSKREGKIETLARETFRDNIVGTRSTQRAIAGNTKKTEAKAEAKRKEARASGVATPLLRKEEAAIAQKKKVVKEKVDRWFKRGAYALDKINDANIKGRVSLSDIKNDPDFATLSPSAQKEAIDLFKTVAYSQGADTLTKEQLKKLLAQASLRGQTGTALFKKLEKRISKLKEPEMKKEIAKIVKQRVGVPKGVKTEDDVLGWFASMNESGEIPAEADINSDGVIDKREADLFNLGIFKGSLKRAGVPVAVVYPDEAPERFKKDCIKIHDSLRDWYKGEFSSFMNKVGIDTSSSKESSDVKNVAIRGKFKELAELTWPGQNVLDREFFMSHKYNVVNGSRVLGSHETKAKAVSEKEVLIAKAISAAPGIRSDLISNKFKVI